MKWISPLLYTVLLLLITGLSIGGEAVVREMGILGPYQGYIDVQTFLFFDIAIIVFGVPIFWAANFLINRLEGNMGATKGVHFRQSAGYYLIGLVCLFTWVSNGFGNAEEDGYLLIWLGISIVAIVVNFLFLRRLQQLSTST